MEETTHQNSPQLTQIVPPQLTRMVLPQNARAEPLHVHICTKAMRKLPKKKSSAENPSGTHPNGTSMLHTPEPTATGRTPSPLRKHGLV